MRLKNILITVSDIERSVEFYKSLFGLEKISYNEGKVILTEGLVLQDLGVFREHIRTDIIRKNNAFLIYFYESDMVKFAEKLEALYPHTDYMERLREADGKKFVRFYDLGGNLIEVGDSI